MGVLITAIVITIAIKHFWEKGAREYAHTRDTAAAQLARQHAGWSPRKIQRHARRRARTYWWDQIREGFPDLKQAYEEDRLAAEAERARAVLDGVKRRKEMRDRIREAMEEHHRIREQERLEEESRRQPVVEEPRPADDARPTPAPASPAAPEPPPAPAAGEGAKRQPPVQEPYTGPGGPAPAPHVPPRTPDRPAGASERDRPDPDDPPPAGKPDATVTPIRPTPASSTGPARPPTPSSGEATVTNVPTGEYTGFESATNDWEALSEVLGDLNRFFEARMSAYRRLNMDDETIEQANHCKAKAEELATAIAEAGEHWQDSHGSVKERVDATGAHGDAEAYA